MRLAKRVRNLAESATLAVASKAARMRADGIDVISFGAGEPDFDTPAAIKQAAIAALEAGHTKYAKPASGIPEAKEAVCRKFGRENSLHYKPEQVIITAGGKMAVSLVIQALVDEGDEVVIPAPYWVSYPEITKLAGGVPVIVTGPQSNDFKLSPEDLKPVLNDRTKLFLLTSPSNPSGVTYTPDELAALADVLVAHDLFVMADEIYDRLLFDGQASASYGAISDKTFAQTITINSLSKTYAMTGWRMGYAAGPVDVIGAMRKLQSQSTSGATTFNQHALVEALTGDQSSVEPMRVEFERRAHFMYDRLTGMPGVQCPKPTGAFYCFPNFSECYAKCGAADSSAFAELLLEQARVAVVPGVAFGMDEHVRLSFATSMEKIQEGLNRIERFLKA